MSALESILYDFLTVKVHWDRPNTNFYYVINHFEELMILDVIVWNIRLLYFIELQIDIIK